MTLPVNLDALTPAATDLRTASPTALRQAAMQFEALLLQQLTSALNVSDDDGEDNLFGGDAGTSLARQMFSEQLATAMSRAGGIGLADSLLRQVQARQAQASPAAAAPEAGGIKLPAARPAAAAPPVKATAPAAPAVTKAPAPPTVAAADTAPAMRPMPVRDAAPRPPVAPVVKALAHPGAMPLTTGIIDTTPPAVTSEDEAPRTIYKVEFAPPLVLPGERHSGTSPAAAKPAAVTDKPVKTAAPSANADATPLQWPVRGRVSSRFGQRSDPINGVKKNHKGLDIAVPRGTPIAAAGEGVVVFAGWGDRYGNNVVIEHPDGRRTRYAHADKLLVAEGEQVQAGQTIAASGSTGRSTGPHVHFEVIENGAQVNPLRALANDFPASRR